MEQLKRVIFAGTPEIAAAVLKAALAQNFPIVAILTQPDKRSGRNQKITPSPVKALAEQHGIRLLQPPSLKEVTPGSALYQEFQDLAPDLILVMAYGLLIPSALLALPKFGCINLHVSLLPRWRGASPIQHAILSGDKTSGITVMQMDQGMDTGDILAQYACTLAPQETADTLEGKLIILASTALQNLKSDLENGTLVRTAQDHIHATYAPKITPVMAAVNWHDSAELIERKIRAFNPKPGAYTHYNNKQIKIWLAEAYGHNIKALPSGGSILEIDKTGISVAANNSVLKILEIQLPGKNRIGASAIYNGYRNFFIPGTIFN